MGRIIVVGDVHGMFSKLLDLIDTIRPKSEDRIIFVGDLIDRGPDSDRVVDFVRKNCFDCVRGNHEQMVIAAQNSSHWFDTWLYNGGGTTLTAYKGREDQLKADIEWMKTLPLHVMMGERWLVSHAGVQRGQTLHDAQKPDAKGYLPILWHRGELEQLEYVQVVGHTPLPEPVFREKEIYVDTGAFAGGPLTAVDLSHLTIHQSR